MGGTTADELNYSNGPTRVCGSDEAYAVDVVIGADSRKRISVDDQPLSSGVEGVVSVGTSPVELKVSTSRLTGRRNLSFMPFDGLIYYGFSPSVSTSTGIKVFNNQHVSLDAGNVAIYAISAVALGVNVIVMEAK
jgi:hypothetical protein